MFKRYNINDLFLAHVVIYLKDAKSSYGYLTILKKNDVNYTDLQNLDRVVTPSMIYKIEALSNYYTQEGKRKNITRKNAINISKNYYNVLLPNEKVRSL